MIERTYYLRQIIEAFELHQVCAILGTRQSGKTTLAKTYCQNISIMHFFDLENPQDLAALENPSITLSNLDGLIVIEEIQRRPDLFAYNV